MGPTLTADGGVCSGLGGRLFAAGPSPPPIEKTEILSLCTTPLLLSGQMQPDQGKGHENIRLTTYEAVASSLSFFEASPPSVVWLAIVAMTARGTSYEQSETQNNRRVEEAKAMWENGKSPAAGPMQLSRQLFCLQYLISPLRLRALLCSARRRSSSGVYSHRHKSGQVICSWSSSSYLLVCRSSVRKLRAGNTSRIH